MKRGYGDGGIDARGEGAWRIRYRINGQRFAKTIRGTKADAQKAVRELLRAGDTNSHVAPDKIPVAQWAEHWISIGCPGNKRRKRVSERSQERYAELLRLHVLPVIGHRPLQHLQPSEIDALYVKLSDKMAARTAHHVHSVLGACLGTAARTGKIAQSHAQARKSPGTR